MPLTKNQLAYILSSTSAKNWSRPTLEYAYYLANSHVVVSTDSYHLHEIQWIDLWPNDLIIDDKSIYPVPTTYKKFPDYLHFFPTDSTTIKTKLNASNIKLARDIAKVSLDDQAVTLTSWIIKAYQQKKFDNLDALDFQVKAYHHPTDATLPTIWFNIDYLYQHTRYIDKPHTASISIKHDRSPIVLESTIDNHPVRTIIMPLKI